MSREVSDAGDPRPRVQLLRLAMIDSVQSGQRLARTYATQAAHPEQRS
eukprot:CAMPEP_0114263136 /NCGR_PEP_ID=MMETSP0058-20121206/22290_1 /TAXON_ID=36894 /ORGANISM="Pyramimonas parkeae, CCMP726" /LENGTH=47 /DNA_ID= /DNA_START= /DNA_END= /DNA_ORIENTATION=